MKSVRIYKHGGPDVLIWEDTAAPDPGPDQVIVDVKNSSLNHLDIWVRNGIPGVPLPFTPGSDAAGIISAAGENVDQNRVGERVLIQPLIYCGNCASCKRGWENMCSRGGIMGESHPGNHAQKIAVKQSQAVPIPDSLPLPQAAAFALVAQTSYQMLVNRAQLETDGWVMVWGAGSGVGSMAIQIAKAKQARVIAISGSDQKLEKAKNLGADICINYQNDDVIRMVKKETDGKGVNIVFEHVGEATWDISMRSLAKGGRVVTCGATSGARASVNLTHLFFKQQSILGSTMGSLSAFRGSMELLFTGKIVPIVDKIFPMEQIADAHIYLESASQYGKVVLSNE